MPPGTSNALLGFGKHLKLLLLLGALCQTRLMLRSRQGQGSGLRAWGSEQNSILQEKHRSGAAWPCRDSREEQTPPQTSKRALVGSHFPAPAHPFLTHWDLLLAGPALAQRFRSGYKSCG